MSSIPLNAVSPPNDPRLSPNTTSFGRWSTGSWLHTPIHRVEQVTPRLLRGPLVAMNEIQLGR